MSAHSSPHTHSPHQIIILIGLMGAGKTTLGRLLAQQYDIPFVDTDQEVQKAAGASIADIFAHHGEAHFREGERRVIARLLQNGPCVLATGGGAWMDVRTRKLIQQTPHACTIWLRVAPHIIAERIKNSGSTRPLLAQGNPHEVLQALASRRNPVYAQADIIVQCGDENVEQAIHTIDHALKDFTSPRRVPIALANHRYDILTGPHLLERSASLLGPHIRNNHAVIITDETVAELHLHTLLSALEPTNIRLDVIRIPAGESSKSLPRYSAVIEELLRIGIERSTTIIAFGGGVVGDFAGFIAATALRGLPFIQIPTTLLAQVDSSVGGKTGINASSGKNLIGAFWQPQLVIADTSVLQTLPRRQRVAGYAEIVKSALIADPELFSWCEEHGADVLDGSPQALETAVQKACQFKARVVAADERESAASGGRALLNLGHTFAHAFEAEFHYDGRLLHGEAVSVGLHMAMALSVQLGLASDNDLKRLDHHLSALSMPTIPADLPHSLGAAILMKHMTRDKKVENGNIKFILLRGIGEAFTCQNVTMEEINKLLSNEGCLN